MTQSSDDQASVPEGGRNFYFCCHIQAASLVTKNPYFRGPTQPQYPVETSGSVCGDKEAGGGSQPLLCLMLRLRTCGTLLPLPPYTLMAWCLGLEITFTFDSANHAGNEDNCHLGCAAMYSVDHYQCFGGTCCLHLQFRRVGLYLLMYQITWHHIS
jgi:hypothetical protein